MSAFIHAARGRDAVSGASFAGWDQTGLLEALLRSLSRNPEHIDEAARLIADLESTSEGEDLLPERLREIWDPGVGGGGRCSGHEPH